MTFASAMFNRPDLDQSRQALALYVEGILPRAAPSLAYEGRLQIHNAVGDCTIKLLSGNLPPGATLSVDQTTKEVVLTWPAYTEQAAPIQNPGFEDGAVGWDFGAGWSVTTDNPIAGARSAAYDNNHGDSFIESRSWLPTNVGDVVNASCAVRQGASSSGNAGGAVRLQYRDAAGQVVYTVEGNPITQGSNNVVRTSNVMGVTPAEAVTINIAGRGIRKRQNRRAWVDSFAWDHKIPAVGINIDSQVCLSLQVDDSAGRSAEWAGCFLVTLWDYTWTATDVSAVGGARMLVAHPSQDLAVMTNTSAGISTFQSLSTNVWIPSAALTGKYCLAYSPVADVWVFADRPAVTAATGSLHWSSDLSTFTAVSNSGVALPGGAVTWSDAHQKFYAINPARWAESADGKTFVSSNMAGALTFFPTFLEYIPQLAQFICYDGHFSGGATRPVAYAPTPAGPWTTVNVAVGITQRCVWSPQLHRLVAVGGTAYWTDDLVTWTACTFDPAITALPSYAGIHFPSWSPDLAMFVAFIRAGASVQNRRFAYSRDGRHWELGPQQIWDESVSAAQVLGSCWCPSIGKFLAVGATTAQRMAYSNT